MISMPIQKPGTARNKMLMNRAMLSPQLFGRSALTIATGMPTTQDSTTESNAISAVRGPRRSSMSATLSERKNEWPKLPDAMSRIHRRYCTISGSLRPSCAM